MNLFETEPQVVIPEIAPTWKCSVTGLVVPKSLQENLEFRKKILSGAERDAGLQKEILAACKASHLFFVNTFCYTETFFQVDEYGRSHNRHDKWQPFISWPRQDDMSLAIHECSISGKPLLIEKSREIGATWIMTYVLANRFLFGDNFQAAILSMKEDDVDNVAGDITSYPHGIISDPATLFGKLDYVLKFLPAWMLPPMNRKRLHLVNKATRSRIDGGASGSFAFSGQRRDLLVFDEAAKIENFEGIWEGTTDVAKGRIANSTPVGLGTYFTKLRNSGQIPVFEFGWWQAPDKAFDLEAEKLPDGKYRYTSSWYRVECAGRSPNDIACNLDINHVDSGTTFFETSILEAYKKKNCVPELLRLRIEFRPEVPEADIFGAIATSNIAKVKVTLDPKGPWKLWFRPATENQNAKEGEYGLLPERGQLLVFGVDVSMGLGASNSVISVLSKNKREKLAEYADANTPPHALAKHVAAACIFFGQGVKPLVVPEVNGIPGIDFMRQLSQIYHYPNIYRERTFGNRHEKQTESVGFHSSRPKKAAILGNLRRAYSVGNYLNPSQLSVDEALSYIIYPSGAIGPAVLMRESENARLTHGDRAMADALTLWPGNEAQAYQDQKQKAKNGDLTPFDINKSPEGSAGWRYLNRDRLGLLQPKRKLSDLKPGERWQVRDYV